MELMAFYSVVTCLLYSVLKLAPNEYAPRWQPRSVIFVWRICKKKEITRLAPGPQGANKSNELVRGGLRPGVIGRAVLGASFRSTQRVT